MSRDAYNPEKCNAWSELEFHSSTKPTKPKPSSIAEHRDALAGRHGKLQSAARAVIEAGRPHLGLPQGHNCLCARCQTWDALRDLLEAK